MPKKESEAQNNETHRHNWVHFLVVLIIAIAVLLIFTNGFSSGTAGAVRSGGGAKKPDLKPLVFDAELVSYGEYQSRGMFFIATIANIGDTKAIKPVVQLREDRYENGQQSSWRADYELGPIPPNGGTATAQSYSEPNLPFTVGKYYFYAIADPYSKISESNEENNYLSGYVIMNCTSAYPDPVYGFNCCLTFEGTAWKKSGTICY